MDSFTTWTLRGLSAKQGKSRLSQISDIINWDPIRDILDEMYDNKSERGGRPNCDVILMFKILILQRWYGLSDLEVERQMADRISFMAFLGFPDPFPDSRTIWLFKERMGKTGKDQIVWAELQRQLDDMGLQVSLTLVSESLDVVETLSAERFRMQPSLKPILDHQINLGAKRPGPGAAVMEPGPRKAMRLISDTSCIN
jgi:IS5 family transposase